MTYEYIEVPFEIKEVQDDGTFSGFAAAIGNVDQGGDKIMPGAFAKTLKKNKGVVPVLAGHDRSSHIGWGVNAEEKPKGLAVEGKLDLNVQAAREQHSLSKMAVELGTSMGLSIGYSAPKTAYEGDVRLLKEVALYEYSLTPFPMNPKARIQGIKHYLEKMEHTTSEEIGELVVGTPRELEETLREAGVSRQKAVAITSKIFNPQREADGAKELIEAIEKVERSIKSGIYKN